MIETRDTCIVVHSTCRAFPDKTTRMSSHAVFSVLMPDTRGNHEEMVYLSLLQASYPVIELPLDIFTTRCIDHCKVHLFCFFFPPLCMAIFLDPSSRRREVAGKYLHIL